MTFDIDWIGGLGGALFGIAAFPSVWKAIRTGSAVEVPFATIAIFWAACLTYFGWLFAKFGIHWPFFFGGLETCSWTVIGWYHFFPRRKVVGVSSVGTALYAEDLPPRDNGPDK